MIDWNYIVSQIATVAFDILYFGAIISTIVIIILDNRNPVKTMAWILILLFLPIVGLVFYFFFGRSQRRERIIGQKSYDRLLKKPMADIRLSNCFTKNRKPLTHSAKPITFYMILHGNLSLSRV